MSAVLKEISAVLRNHRGNNREKTTANPNILQCNNLCVTTWLNIEKKKFAKYFTFPAFQILTYFVIINSHKLLFKMEQPHDQSLQAWQRQMKPKMQRFIIFMRLLINDTGQTHLFTARYEHSVALNSKRQRQNTCLQRYYFMTYMSFFHTSAWVTRFDFCFFNNSQSLKFIYQISRIFLFSFAIDYHLHLQNCQEAYSKCNLMLVFSSYLLGFLESSNKVQLT